MGADSLAPCVARSSTVMVLTMQDNGLFIVLVEERFQVPERYKMERF